MSTKDKPLKAYEVRDPEEGTCVIVFATNGATARRDGANELNTEFECVESCRRAPWADEYAPGPVPLHATLAAGWWHECGHCCCRFDNEGRQGCEYEDERDDACEPVQRGIFNYCSETCAQKQWAERLERAARERAAIDAAYMHFPDASVIKAYESSSGKEHCWRVAFLVPGLQCAVHWTVGQKTADVSRCDVDAFTAWTLAQKRF